MAVAFYGRRRKELIVSGATPPLRSLPERPDLDQLKRQAKELLAAYREGDADAVAEVSHHYRGADPAMFALHDAQLVIARASGFDSWPKLKALVDGATVTQLNAAVRAGDVAKVRAILDARPEIINMEGPNGDEHRALHFAVEMRSLEMVRVLMAYGADAHVGVYPHRPPTTALAMATERGYDEIVTAIRDAEEKRPGHDPKWTRYGRDPETPLPPPDFLDAMKRADSAAAIAALEPLVRADPNVIKWTEPGTNATLLHVAAARVMVDFATWLIDQGADVRATGTHGNMPIDVIGMWPVTRPPQGVEEFADLLFRHGAERTRRWAVSTNNLEWLRARHAEGTLDPRGLVTLAVERDRSEVLRLLLDFGFNPDEPPDPATGGRTPLLACAKHRRDAMADLLLERGATLTPTLAVALGKGDWLRARHAEGLLEHPKEGDKLFTVAVNYDRADMVELLLELGLDLRERGRVVGGDSVGEGHGTPLVGSAGRGNVAIAEILLKHGADPNESGPGGGTATSHAYRQRDQAMLDLLMKHGGVISAVTAALHRDVAIVRQRIEEEDAGRLPAGAVTPGKTVAEELLGGDAGEPDIIRMALERIDWPRDDPRWYWVLKGPTTFWNHIPWIASPKWQLPRDGYLASFRLILARCDPNVGGSQVWGSFRRTILHDVMAMGFHDGASGWISDEEALPFAVALLDAGARTDVRDEMLKSTPLGWACRWGRTPIVAEMLRRGIDHVEADAEPWATPRAWAEKMGHREIVAMLGQR
jgi:ankyrin repeat protein